MHRIMSLLGCLFGFISHAVLYDEYEINFELNQPELAQLSQQFTQNYFTSSTAKTVIDDILKADISPLQREYIFFNLLSEISQHPPQAFHQYFVDLMKRHPIQATKHGEEGPFPVAVFNINSKAHGIENIWIAYRTEQHFNQLFANNIKLAITDIQSSLADQSHRKRPTWLGIKNSIAALSNEKLTELVHHLQNTKKNTIGFDQLISHVGLLSADDDLIHKALSSEDQSIRQLTLRHLTSYLPSDVAKSWLLNVAASKQDAEFATSMLAAFSNDLEVQNHLIQQLSSDKLADMAAFALSQSSDISLPERLRIEYLHSTDEKTQNHILLSLKLNPSNTAKLALSDLKVHINSNTSGAKWLKSFDGEQP